MQHLRLFVLCSFALMLSLPSTLQAENDLGTIRSAQSVLGSILTTNIKHVQVKGEANPRPIIVTGKNHFHALWTRDTIYAMPGLLAMGRTDVVNSILELLISRVDAERKLLPRRIGPGPNYIGVLLAAFGKKLPQNKPFRTVEYNSPFGSPQFDSNPLVSIATLRYAEQTRDLTFLRWAYPTLKASIDFYDKYKNSDGLITSPPHSDWKDMLSRPGVVSYTNALYYQQLTSLGRIASMLGEQADQQDFAEQAAAFRAVFEAKLWNAERGWFMDSTRFDEYFSDADNAIVLRAGLGNKVQRVEVLDKFRASFSARGLPPIMEGSYPATMLPLILHIAGTRHYMDTYIWPWIAAAYGEILLAEGDKTTALAVAKELAALILRYGDMRECYERQGKDLIPVKTRFYNTEENFTWNTGWSYAFFHSVLASAE